MGQKFRRAKSILILLLFALGLASAAPSQQLYQLQLWDNKTIAPVKLDLGNENILPASYLKLRRIHQAEGIYDLEELAVDLDGSFPNPFDPKQIDLQVQFSSPSGKKISIAAFWYQEFDPNTLQPKDDPGFRVRFTPIQAGKWTAQAYLLGTALKSEPLNFNVAPNRLSHGFVRLNKTNSHYLAFDDEKLYFPIGLNLAWSRHDVLADYQQWMDQLAQNGGNTIRVWMASWSFGIEWKDTGLGNYTNRLRQAWLLDQVFSMAQEHGIYIMLTLINHGAFSTQADPEWQQNPYNTTLDGPCQNPQDFASDPLAREYFKRRLRYISSRWAYSPNLMAWEWWNEVNWTPLNDVQLLPWLHEMNTFLENADPYHHLVTNSYKRGDHSNLWSMPDLNLAQVHDYSGNDPVVHFPDLYARLTVQAGNKPALVGEYGNPSLQTDNLIDRSGIHFHNGLWAAPFSGFAGTAMYWWWDQFIDPQSLWPQFKTISDFLIDENLAQLKPGRGTVYPDHATALTLSNPQRALIWIRNRNYNIAATRIAYSAALIFNKTDPSWQYQPQKLTGLSLTINGLNDGSYVIHWYSPQTAHWLGETAVQVASNTLHLPLPPFESDLALKILPAP